MRRTTLLSIILLVPFMAIAQDNSDKTVSYFSAQNKLVDRKVAKYVRHYIESDQLQVWKTYLLQDSILYSIDSFDIKQEFQYSEMLQRRDSTSFLSEKNRSVYYPNGQLHFIKFYDNPQRFKAGKMDSLIVYYPNGKVKGKEYAKEAYGTNLRFDPNGLPLAFTSFESSAQFPKGEDSLYQYLSKNIKYPREAYTNDIQGQVYIQFVVCEDGSLCNYEIIRGVHPLLNKEAIRCIKNMPPWEPKRIDGQGKNTEYILPIQFSLGE